MDIGLVFFFFIGSLDLLSINTYSKFGKQIADFDRGLISLTLSFLILLIAKYLLKEKPEDKVYICKDCQEAYN